MKMVLVLDATFDAAWFDKFFTAADQLNLPARSQLKLAQEGIASITNLVDFDDKDISAP